MDVESGKLLHTLAGHGRDLTVLTFSDDGQRLATAGQDDTVKVWDVATGQEVLSRPAPRSVVDIGFTRDRKKLLAVGVTITETTNAKLRLFRVPELVSVSLGLAFLALAMRFL